MMWIPDKLYGKMPLLYAAGGVGTLSLFGTYAPAAISSVLLFAAAGTTYVWRHKRRILRRQRRPGSLHRPPRQA